jgi:hypothetical protein
MKTSSIDEFSASIVTANKPIADPLLSVGAVGEASQFNLFNMADLMLTYRSRPPMTFDRRPFYKISLLRGRSRVEYTDRVVEIDQSSLFFATPREPYRWVPYDLAQTGYFCVFTDEFLRTSQSKVCVPSLLLTTRCNCPFDTSVSGSGTVTLIRMESGSSYIWSLQGHHTLAPNP